VRGHRDIAPDIRRQRFAEAGTQPGAQRGLERFAAGWHRRFAAVGHGLQERGNAVGKRREPIAERLRQRLQQDRELLADQPGTSHVRSASSIWFRSASGTVSVKPSPGWPWRKAVLEREHHIRHRQRLREERLRHVCRRVAHQSLARHEQHGGILALGLGAPMLEARERMDVFGNALRVEGCQRLVVDEHILTPRLVLELGHVGDELAVVGQEPSLRCKSAGTSASRTNTSRASFGSMLPNDTRRRATSVKP
jgi:hypothetical protein